jgi:hypothetical protein
MLAFRRCWILLALAAGCYSPNLQNGKQQCGLKGECPSGYQCGPDDHCYKMGQVPNVVPDMAVGDLAMVCTAMTCKGTAKPICDTMSGQCIECNTDDNCPSGKVCSQKACVPGCTMAHGCPDGGGMCDPSSKMCKRCMSDGDCGGGTPRCDPASGECVVCLPTMDNCPMGKFCGQVNMVYTCQVGCQTVADCPGTDGGGKPACCNHVCVDTDVDGTNCGGCGMACGNQTCCSGMCFDLGTDLNNCGMCGTACSGKHAMWSCAKSMCAVTTCTAGFGDCDGDSSNGCEATLATDVNNCNMCNMRCTGANATMACVAGACAIGMCNAGFGDCDKLPGTGCEVNTNSDVNNCGGCNMKCNLANATAACVNGKCAVAMCTNGFQDCDNNPLNGCETNVTNDKSNCGMCGMACPGVPNATVACSAGKCAIASCTGVFKDCDGAFGNGCEINPTSDVNNCSACGMKCQAGANVASMSCVNSACAIASCNPNFGNCDGNVPNGCETNLTNNNANCSKCAMACPNGFACVNSGCVNNTVTYSDNFTLNGNTTPANCTTWNNFIAALTGSYNSITIKGSLDGVGVTCTNSGANEPNQLIAAMRSNGAVSIACSGRTWAVGQCSGVELSAMGSICACPTPGYIVRACIGNANWGGVNSATCGGPTQTITVVAQ